jgi:hypothetical protein
MTEELKIIMETIGQLGQAGKDAFMWWLLIKYGMSYLLGLVAVSVIGYVVFRIAKFVHFSSTDTDLVKRLCTKMGCVGQYGNFEREKMYEKVLALVDKS